MTLPASRSSQPNKRNRNDADSNGYGNPPVCHASLLFKSALEPSRVADTVTPPDSDPPLAVAVLISASSGLPLADVDAPAAEPQPPKPSAAGAVLQRFLSKISEPNERGCMLWKGSLTRNGGYGDFWCDGASVVSHRFAWELFVGPVPAGLWVLHQCDVRACVNPKHLFLGTNQDNVDDMVRKGRNKISVDGLRSIDRKGEKSSKARLTELQAKDILQRHAKGETPASLARAFGVARQTVSSLVCGDTWLHLDRPASKNTTASRSFAFNATSENATQDPQSSSSDIFNHHQ